uniref:Uncharacterized protein n=1 Tax=Arundo donax TaxID=35708 RepID=A0A0A8XUF0_ARUDO
MNIPRLGPAMLMREPYKIIIFSSSSYSSTKY